MSSTRWFLLIAALFGLALAVSGVLYVRSQSADYDAHARAVEALGQTRNQNERLSELVLAARFGLLNQYDPLTSTGQDLSLVSDSVRERLSAVVRSTPELDKALSELTAGVGEQLKTVERFKGENSILKNSMHYLPTAVQELSNRLALSGSQDRSTLEVDAFRVGQAALVFNLIGDESTRVSHDAALKALETSREKAAPELHAGLDAILAHGHVIARMQPLVDQRVKQVLESDLSTRIERVQNVYLSLFAQNVASANRFRKVLYAWSLLLLLGICGAGLQLRRLYAGLEQRVSERTAELRNALSALWGEMKLARKIQEALVPLRPELSSCEIAVSMRPTDDVGGDYYDVMRVGGREWILIGDVSGHGVPAGLIMMMCHTAVRTVLQGEPGIAPDRLLARVNVVLTENIRQLGEDKYMTISAFRRDADGRVSYAGAHQDIHIYRASSGKIETLETQGMWLGIKDQIGEMLSSSEFQLLRGDVLLLHTDGITEATRDGKLFDNAGLQAVLSRASGKSANQVLSELFAALDGYQLADDATLLVLKELQANGESSVARAS
ncbi:MAG TPA: DAHL domain-containing protein [Polyangiaceae bacterium]|jgi:serine phosphatase RsbU (regulator of sigma subunit)